MTYPSWAGRSGRSEDADINTELLSHAFNHFITASAKKPVQESFALKNPLSLCLKTFQLITQAF
jgi:hypothetical protein